MPLLELKANKHCSLSTINAANCSLYNIINRRYENFFDFEQVTWLTIVYKTLYATADKVFVPMAHNCTTEARIITDVVLS